MKHVIIVGGGPAGMMAAIAAAESGAIVDLYEKNEKLGKKLFITGKGRCNVTNACDIEDLFKNTIHNHKFMYSSFYEYTNQMIMDFFEANGCPLKIERGNRVFPVSDHSSDIIACLQKVLKQMNVDVHLNQGVKELILQDDRVIGVRLSDGKGTEVCSDAVIVSTGGLSYPSTGSTGDGFAFAKKAGHTVTELLPALVPFEALEEDVRSLMGLSLKNISVRILDDKKCLYEDFGEMLFTHFGVSGPTLLSASSIVIEKLKTGPLRLSVNFKPALTKEQLDKRLLREFEENKNKQYKNILGALLPAKLVPVFMKRSNIDPDQKVNEITKEQREKIIELLTDFTVTLTGVRGFSEAIITRGGIHIKEINPSTMESKIINNLYFAGEILDVDALTGGYNLQIAWSTGHLAGINAAKQMEE